jgi:hypothetical protein
MNAPQDRGNIGEKVDNNETKNNQEIDNKRKCSSPLIRKKKYQKRVENREKD